MVQDENEQCTIYFYSLHLGVYKNPKGWYYYRKILR